MFTLFMLMIASGIYTLWELDIAYQFYDNLPPDYRQEIDQADLSLTV